MKVTVTSNVAKVAADLDHVARKQLPYATALALTRVSQDAKAELRSGLRQHFTIRSGWVSRGIVHEQARKASWPIAAVVATKDEFMARQAEGGTKKALGGKELGVPVAVRRVASAITPRSKWPSALLRKKRQKYFVMSVKSGKMAGRKAVFQRTGPAGRGLALQYILQRTVQVKPNWPFHQTVEKTVTKTYDWRFGQSLAKALASRR